MYIVAKLLVQDAAWRLATVVGESSSRQDEAQGNLIYIPTKCRCYCKRKTIQSNTRQESVAQSGRFSVQMLLVCKLKIKNWIC